MSNCAESSNALSRREVLARAAALASSALLGGCTPLRVLLAADTRGFVPAADRLEPTLSAFVSAVIPGAPEDDASVARAHLDPAYPFARHVRYFVGDLRRRSKRLFGTSELSHLSLEERVVVIRDGLSADAITRRLYDGAIFLAQIAVYSGIYDDRPGCALIDFEGPYRLRDPRDLTYPDGSSFLPHALTRDGNPV